MATKKQKTVATILTATVLATNLVTTSVYTHNQLYPNYAPHKTVEAPANIPAFTTGAMGNYEGAVSSSLLHQDAFFASEQYLYNPTTVSDIGINTIYTMLLQSLLLSHHKGEDDADFPHAVIATKTGTITTRVSGITEHYSLGGGEEDTHNPSDISSGLEGTMITHIIPAWEAWKMGGYAWSKQERQKFYNDQAGFTYVSSYEWDTMLKDWNGSWVGLNGLNGINYYALGVHHLFHTYKLKPYGKWVELKNWADAYVENIKPLEDGSSLVQGYGELWFRGGQYMPVKDARKHKYLLNYYVKNIMNRDYYTRMLGNKYVPGVTPTIDARLFLYSEFPSGMKPYENDSRDMGVEEWRLSQNYTLAMLKYLWGENKRKPEIPAALTPSPVCHYEKLVCDTPVFNDDSDLRNFDKDFRSGVFWNAEAGLGSDFHRDVTEKLFKEKFDAAVEEINKRDQGIFWASKYYQMFARLAGWNYLGDNGKAVF